MKKLIVAIVIISASLVATNAFALIGIDNYTVLMLHGNGTDGSTNFVDSSFSNHPVTAYGDAQIDTAQKKFGTGSALFDGDGDYLSIPDSDDWCFGTGDFTMDFWVKFNALPSGSSMHLLGQWLTNELCYQFRVRESAGIHYISFNGSSDGSSVDFAGVEVPWSPSVNTWYHFAFVRNGDRLDLYSNGISLANNTDVGFNFYSANEALYIGRLHDGTEDFNGWLDEIRISKGVARWTSDFTPPTSEYEVIPEPSTLLLLGFGLLGALFRKKS